MAKWVRKENQGESETVRARLFDAILRGNAETVAAICDQHSQAIIEQFDNWKRPPEAIKHSPEEMNAWAHCLITTAKAFNSAGHPQLLASIHWDAEDNPIDRWTSTSVKAQRLSDTGRYKESNGALLEIIEEMGGCVGSAIDTLRPKIYGLLGTNHFRTGEFVRAREYTELALADSERTNDRQGMAVYTENLATLLAMGANSPAAHCRKTIAKAQDLSDQLWYERSNVLLREVSKAIEVHPELRSYQSKVYGLMGFNHFRLGEIQHAKDYTEQAMQYCRDDRDHKGVQVYAENLKMISK